MIFRPPSIAARRESGPNVNVAFLLSVAVFDGLHGVLKCPFQNPLSDGAEQETERPPFEILALPYDNGVHIGRSVGPPAKGVKVPRPTAPNVGVNRLHDHAALIGPVVSEALPDSTRPFGDVSVRSTPVMHLEVLVRAVAKELRAPWSEVDERSKQLVWRRLRRLVQVNRGHRYSLATIAGTVGDAAANLPRCCHPPVRSATDTRYAPRRAAMI